MAKKRCVFCNRSSVTKEHIFPAWIGKAMRKDPVWRDKFLGGRAGYWSGPKTNEWTTDRPLGMEANLVCAKCNSRWMGDIENTAKPILTKMIFGEDTIELDQDTQQVVATWACLRTLLAHSIRPPHPLTRSWYDHLLSTHSPPDGWEIFTTRYTGRFGQFMESSRFELRLAKAGRALPTRAGEKGVLTTILIGYLAIHCRAIVPEILSKGYTRTNILRIWPSSPLVLIWPPRTQISDGRGLESFRRQGFDPASPHSPIPS